MDKREAKNTEKNLDALQFLSIILELVIDKNVTFYTLTKRRPLFNSLPVFVQIVLLFSCYPCELLLNTT